MGRRQFVCGIVDWNVDVRTLPTWREVNAGKFSCRAVMEMRG